MGFACVVTFNTAASADDEVNLGTIARALWRNKRSIIGPTLLDRRGGVHRRQPADAPLQVRSARSGRRPREHLPAARGREGHDATAARSTPRRVTSQVQLVLSRDLAREVIKELNLTELPEFNAALEGVLAAVGAAHHRNSQGSDVDDARGAGARGLLRAAHRLRARQVARDLDRIPVGRSGAGRPRGQHDRRKLSLAAAGRPSRTRRARPGSGFRASSRSCAARCPRPKPRSRIIAPSPICSSAPTTPACRTSSSPS